MRFFTLIAGAFLVGGYGAWLINPGFFDSGAAISSEYAERKADSETMRPVALTARPLSIEEAYRRIPHTRTLFRPDIARMSDVEARYLKALFDLTDQGVVERVVIQESLYWGRGQSLKSNNYDALFAGLMSLPTPEKIMPAETLIAEAIREQQLYLANWRESEDPRFFSRDASLVQSSHMKLISAYEILMRVYGDEPHHNKQAFFDHLCALDFI